MIHALTNRRCTLGNYIVIKISRKTTIIQYSTNFFPFVRKWIHEILKYKSFIKEIGVRGRNGVELSVRPSEKKAWSAKAFITLDGESERFEREKKKHGR